MGRASRPDRDGSAAPAGEAWETLFDFTARRLEASVPRLGESRAIRLDRLGCLAALRGRWEEASVRFEEALTADSRCAPALLNRAHARIEAFGEPPETVDRWERLARARLPIRLARFARAYAGLRWVGAGPWEGSLARLESCPRWSGWVRVARVHLGCAARDETASGRLPGLLGAADPLTASLLRPREGPPPYGAGLALGGWGRGIAWNPLHAEGHHEIARYLRGEGLWTGHREALESAYLLDPDPARLAWGLARWSREVGDEEGVLEQLSRSIERAPDWGPPRRALAREYMRRGCPAEALRLVSDSLGGARGTAPF